MRIVWLKSDYVVPPDSGGKIRTYNLMRQLNRHCELTYVCLKSSPGDPLPAEYRSCADKLVAIHRAEEVKEGPRLYLRVLSRMCSSIPYIVQKYRSREVLEFQRTLARSADDGPPTVVVCDFLDMSANVEWSSPFPKILFQHNVESVVWRRYWENEERLGRRAYFRFEYERLRRYESAVCNRFDRIFVVSPEDQETLAGEMNVRTPIDIIPTGVDGEYYRPMPDVEPVAGRLLFLGSLDWMPNIDGLTWFCRHIYPRICKAHPRVSLDVVGRRPTAAVRRLASSDPSIRIHADVPDVRPFLAAAQALVVPLRIGGGSRLKIFEAMSMRRPVVSTTIGAEGLPVAPGRDIAIGDDPETFAQLAVRMLNDAAWNASTAAHGYALVSENYQWDRIAQNFLQHCRSLLESRTERRRHALAS